MTRAETSRRRAWQIGLTAETQSAWWLRLKGYRILAKRFRTPVGEIDLVARRRRLLVFCEVKARPTYAEAAEAVTPRQRQRIEAASQAFVAENPAYGDFDQRFDALLCVPGRWPSHLIDAWRPDP